MSPHRAVPHQRASDGRIDDAPDRRAFRRNYLLGNAFEAWLALGAVLSGIIYFVSPEALSESSVGRQAGVFAIAWSAMYFAAGVTLMHGLVRPDLRSELAGLSLIGGAIAINATAVVTVRGLQGFGTALLYVSLLCACGMRARLVWTLLKRGVRGRSDG